MPFGKAMLEFMCRSRGLCQHRHPCMGNEQWTVRIEMSKARWPGWTAERTLVLPVPVSAWAPPFNAVTLDGVTFQPKPELHVTLAGTALGNELHAVFEKQYLDDRARVAFAALDWSFLRAGRFLMLRKQARIDGEPKEFCSIIERLQMPAMHRFHIGLGRMLGRELAVPPPHATLFTAGRDKGIGVANARQLRAYAPREVSR
ncbi:MAG TPA: hypothetical protein VEY92_02380, partial [Pseudoxanthomonas sp.]|nr:hypothetical protein [Pseudoxanthomonas sp.]